MAKQLSELMKKVDPAVIEAVRIQADQEIFELRLAELRQTGEVSQLDMDKTRCRIYTLHKMENEDSDATNTKTKIDMRTNYGTIGYK